MWYVIFLYMHCLSYIKRNYITDVLLQQNEFMYISKLENICVILWTFVIN